MIKKRRKTYYVALNKANNTIEICTSKTEAGRFVNISYDTVRRHLERTSFYDTLLYSVWKDVVLVKSKRTDNAKCRKQF